MNQFSCQMIFLQVWIRSKTSWTVDFYWPEWILFVKYLCGGCSLVHAHATTSSLTDCWMNIPLTDLTDNWPDVLTSSPQASSTWQRPGDFKNFRVGAHPTCWLPSAADWCFWTKRKDILSMSICLRTSRLMLAVAFELIPNDHILSGLIALSSQIIIRVTGLMNSETMCITLIPPWSCCSLVTANVFRVMLPCQVLSFSMSGALAIVY